VSRPERYWWPMIGRVSGTSLLPVPAGETRRGPIDPLTGPILALAGRVVTMDDAFTVKDDAIVYIDKVDIATTRGRD
jgi:5-methylthioadenosine/S-adenosylhomocysteine deaminase